MKQIAALTLLSSLIYAPPAYADVNMLEGSFRTTFIDAKIANLKIERRYDSRSTFSGLFGFGWCSTFDTELDFKTLKIKDCGKPSTSAAHYSNKTYVQKLPTGLTRTYDADTGILIGLSAKGAAVAVERPGLPRAAALGEGMRMRPTPLTLEFDPLRENVIAIEIPGSKLLFEYNDKRDLLSARNAWSNTYRYEYDKLHNLTRIDFPDHTTELPTYDTDHDRLTQFQGRDGCIETYEHTISASVSQKTQTSTAKLVCDGKPKRQAVFKFGFIRRGNRFELNSFDRGSK